MQYFPIKIGCHGNAFQKFSATWWTKMAVAGERTKRDRFFYYVISASSTNKNRAQFSALFWCYQGAGHYNSTLRIGRSTPPSCVQPIICGSHILSVAKSLAHWWRQVCFTQLPEAAPCSCWLVLVAEQQHSSSEWATATQRIKQSTPLYHRTDQRRTVGRTDGSDGLGES